MPEGHVLHRAARLQGRRFRGKTVRVSSPQGRFRDGAQAVDGHRIERIHAYGKHLFYDFETGDSVHVHLGLFGKFRVSSLPVERDPSPNCRLLMESETDQLHLAGPTVCEVLDPDGVQAVIDRLGPDPIVRPADGADRFSSRLARRRIPIGAALLDQKVIAGVGNVYRAEFLHMLGIHPFTPANEVERTRSDALWSLAVDELTAGEKLGRIVTVDPAEVGFTRRRDLPRGERLYAYKRHGEPCRRCGTPIVRTDIDGRSIWWCPPCQPA